MEVKKYESKYKNEWNEFLSRSKNSTFLFNREFIEYHKDRFTDNSLLVFNESKIVGLMPCSSIGKQLISHGGLTYGGLLIEKEIKLLDYIQIFYEVLKYLHKAGFENLLYKSLPTIYCEMMSEEQSYVLFLLGAENVRTDTSTAIDYKQQIKFQTRKKRAIKKANKLNLEIKKEDSFDAFWNEVLSPNLVEKFNKKPVHSLEEITLLSKSFPSNIKQYNIYNEDHILAGVTIFDTKFCAHAQYISSNDAGKDCGALDKLFEYLITEEYAHKKYFDFGISNENMGLHVNKGLLGWKEGFGGRTIAHPFHSIAIANYLLLEKVLLN